MKLSMNGINYYNVSEAAAGQLVIIIIKVEEIS